MISKIETLGRTYRYVQRYRQILFVLSKYGFDNLVDGLMSFERQMENNLTRMFRGERDPIETLSRAERGRLVIEELGPTFIKMGQILSTRPDLLPSDFILELSKLQKQATPFPFTEAKKIIEAELKITLTDVFAHFEEEPLAAASFGQVHRAKLLDGAEVVVKVQRPNIKRIVEVDLEIMTHIARLLEGQLDSWSIHKPTLVVEEFARLIERELDYTIESSHIERFGWQFEEEATIYVPCVYRKAISRRVLTMEYVDGLSITDMATLDAAGIDRRVIARHGFRLIIQQIFMHGFFHADPHPGNLLILPNNIICYLDFGMMGRIDAQSRQDCADLVLAIIRRNEVKATSALLRLTVTQKKPNRVLLEKEVATFMDQYSYRPLKDIELGKLLYEILDITSRHHLRIPPDIFLMMKALTTVEGLGRKLDPDFDPIRQAQPFVWRIYLNRFAPRRVTSNLIDNSLELINLLQEIPAELNDLVKQVKRGEIEVKFAVKETERALSTLDRISNRLSFAIVLASLVIGSSLMIHARTPPQWNDVSIIGLTGYLVAGVMGFGLLIAILRRGMV